jgi:uncharacterized protein (TIGR00369 family)
VAVVSDILDSNLTLGRSSLESYEQRVRQSFSRQEMMRTLGAELSAVHSGATEIRFPFAPSLTQQHGYVHAGAVTTILDSACGYAALTMAPEGSEVLSVEFKVNLLAPAIGQSIVARAQVKRAGKTLTVCAGDAFALRPEGEKLIATMLATMIYIPVEK